MDYKAAASHTVISLPDWPVVRKGCAGLWGEAWQGVAELGVVQTHSDLVWRSGVSGEGVEVAVGAVGNSLFVSPDL